MLKMWKLMFVVSLSLPTMLSAAKDEIFLPTLPTDSTGLQQNKLWFDAAKFGIFVHWNPSSIEVDKVNMQQHPLLDPNSPYYIENTPREWLEQYSLVNKGTEISWGRIGPRPGKLHKSEVVQDHFTQLPYAQYNQLYKQFKPNKFDPQKWMASFKQAGAKYVVLVSKHHDGFAMFDAKQSLIMDENGYPKVDKNGHALIAAGENSNLGWKISNPKSFARDTLAELSDAARSEGLKVGFYYSNPDWTHPDYDVMPNQEYSGGGTQQLYIDYMYSHVQQLLTEYGEILTIWFDGLSASRPSHWGGMQHYKSLREISPATLFNDRFFFSYHKNSTVNLGIEDYYTPERKKGIFDVEHKWETCDIAVKNHAWSYQKGNPVHSWQKIARDLIDVIDNGGNYLLNIAPDAQGQLRAQEYALLADLGRWIQRHQQGIFNTKAGPFLPKGALSSSHHGQNVYLHVRLHELGNVASLSLPVIQDNALLSAKLISGENITFDAKQDAIELHINQEFYQEPIIQTLVLTYQKKVKGLIELPSSPSIAHFGGHDISSKASSLVALADERYSSRLSNNTVLSVTSSVADFAFHSKKMPDPSLLLILDQDRTVYGLVVTNRQQFAQRAKGMQLSYSTDGEHFINIWQDNSQNAPNIWHINLQQEQTGALVPGIKMRYLRLSLPGKERVFHLKNVKIFGE